MSRGVISGQLCDIGRRYSRVEFHEIKIGLSGIRVRFGSLAAQPLSARVRCYSESGRVRKVALSQSQTWDDTVLLANVFRHVRLRCAFFRNKDAVYLLGRRELRGD